MGCGRREGGSGGSCGAAEQAERRPRGRAYPGSPGCAPREGHTREGRTQGRAHPGKGRALMLPLRVHTHPHPHPTSPPSPAPSFTQEGPFCPQLVTGQAAGGQYCLWTECWVLPRPRLRRFALTCSFSTASGHRGLWALPGAHRELSAPPFISENLPGTPRWDLVCWPWDWWGEQGPASKRKWGWALTQVGLGQTPRSPRPLCWPWQREMAPRLTQKRLLRILRNPGCGLQRSEAPPHSGCDFGSL